MDTPLVLLPGMMCDARLFAPQIAAVSCRRPVLSMALTGAATVPDLAAAVLALAPPRFALAGLSMGGIVAMEIVAQAPGRVERLALMDTNPAPDAPERREGRARLSVQVAAGGLRDVLREELKPLYAVSGPERDRIEAICMAMALDLGPQAFLDQNAALAARPDQRPRLAAVACPALVLCGADDPLCPPAWHEALAAAIPGATLRLIDRAGHLPTLERPDDTTEALRAWLS